MFTPSWQIIGENNLRTEGMIFFSWYLLRQKNKSPMFQSNWQNRSISENPTNIQFWSLRDGNQNFIEHMALARKIANPALRIKTRINKPKDQVSRE